MYAVDERTAPRRLDDSHLEPLVSRAQQGELEAFESLVRALQGPVRAFARRMMGDVQLGDDAAQETFIRIWRGLPRYQAQGRFTAWVFTVARNTCVELLRRETRTPTPTEELPVVADDPTERLDIRRVVADAVARLSEPFRGTLLLQQAGLTYEEIAESSDCPVGTVRSRLHEARRRLAEHLAPLMFGGGNDDG